MLCFPVIVAWNYNKPKNTQHKFSANFIELLTKQDHHKTFYVLLWVGYGILASFSHKSDKFVISPNNIYTYFNKLVMRKTYLTT